jgi:hypothetical protein
MNKIKNIFSNCSTKHSGFSFVVISIMMVFLGLIIYGTISKVVSQGGLRTTQTTKERLYKIEKSINDFVVKNKRLPCPASLTQDFGTQNYGKEQFDKINNQCDLITVGGIFESSANNLLYGAVPVRDLGLTDDYGVDQWGNKLSYVVDNRFTSKTVNVLSATPGGFAYYISDINGSPTIPNIDVDGKHVLFLVLSYGKDKVGGYRAFGSGIYSSGTDINIVTANGFDTSFSLNSTPSDNIGIFGTAEEIKTRSFAAGSDSIDKYSTCVCNETSTTVATHPITFNSSRCGEKVYSNETCPVDSDPVEYYYLSASAKKKPYRTCGKDGNWDIIMNPCTALPACNTGNLQSTYLGYTITWNTSSQGTFANTSKILGTITVNPGQQNETTYTLYSYCKIQDGYTIGSDSAITGATMVWTAPQMQTPPSYCSAISTGSVSNGYAVWGQTAAGVTATGTCVSGFKEAAGGHPTRNCTISGWGTITNSCVADIPYADIPPYTNLKLWLDADSSSTITYDASNNVTEWRDKSGNGFKATQSNTTYSPTYVASGINSMPSVLFNSSQSDYLNLDLDTGSQSSMSIFIVHKMNTQGSTNYILDTSGYNSLTHSNTYRFLVESGTAGSWYSAAHRGGDYMDANIVYKTSWLLDSDTTSTGSVYLNGVFSTDTANNQYTAKRIGYYTTIGANYSKTSYFYNGQISEILVYNRLLNSTEREQVETYLERWRTNLTLPTSCSTISTADQNTGYATWSTTPINTTAIGTCKTNYTINSSAPTRVCTTNGWGTINNPCIPDIPYTGMKLWLDASESNTVTLNGSTVSSWTDKSGNGKNAVQATSTYQPTYTTNSINGLSTLTLDSDDYMTSGSIGDWNFIHNGTGCTVFFVTKILTSTSDSNGVNTLLSTSSTTGTVGILYAYDNRASLSKTHTFFIQMSRGVSGQTTFSFTAANNSFPIQTTNIASFYYKEGLSPEYQAYINTTSYASGNSTYAPSSANSLYTLNIGRFVYAPSWTLRGELAEILIYNTSLTANEYTKVQNYLSSKWGVQ